MRAGVTSVLVVALALTLGPSASADIEDAERRKQQAEAQARRSAQRIDDLSAELRDALAALQSTQSRIPAAQARLSEVRGTLEAVRARAAALATRLQFVEARQARTQAQIDATQARLREVTTIVGRIARTAYENGNLSEWAAVLGAQTPRQLAGGLAALQSSSRAQSALLAGLREARAGLAVSRATLRARGERVARLKSAQDAVVGRIEGLEAQASAAMQSLRQLAQLRAAAAARVRSERTAERGRYERAVAESRRLARRIASQRRAAERRLQRQRARQAARAARHPSDGSSDGRSGGSGLLWPVPGPITTYAGPRTNPVTGSASCHAGIDVAAGYGTPIRAMGNGVVVQTTVNAWDGYTTVIAHGGGLTTWYAHQSRFAVRPGEYVSRGEVIGYVGSSGFSTGPHLHFNIAINEVAYDPLGWFGGARRTVASMCPGGPAPVL